MYVICEAKYRGFSFLGLKVMLRKALEIISEVESTESKTYQTTLELVQMNSRADQKLLQIPLANDGIINKNCNCTEFKLLKYI